MEVARGVEIPDDEENPTTSAQIVYVVDTVAAPGCTYHSGEKQAGLSVGGIPK